MVLGHNTSRLGVPVQKEMANSSNETASRPRINHQSLRPRFGFCAAIASEAISSKRTTCVRLCYALRSESFSSFHLSFSSFHRKSNRQVAKDRRDRREE